MRTTRQSVQSSRAVLIISTGTRTNYLLPMVAAVHVGVLLQTNTVCRILVQHPGGYRVPTAAVETSVVSVRRRVDDGAVAPALLEGDDGSDNPPADL